MCLSAMIRLEIPHINVLTKMDLLESPSEKKRRKKQNMKMEKLHISKSNKKKGREDEDEDEEDEEENEEENEDSDDDEDNNNNEDEDEPYSSSDDVENRLEKFLDPDIGQLISELNREMNPRYHKLNKALGNLIDDYSMVAFVPLNVKVLLL